MYTDGSKINEKVGATAVIKRLFQDGKTTRNLSKRLPDGSSIFSAEANAIILALDYYKAMPAWRSDLLWLSVMPASIPGGGHWVPTYVLYNESSVETELDWIAFV